MLVTFSQIVFNLITDKFTIRSKFKFSSVKGLTLNQSKFSLFRKGLNFATFLFCKRSYPIFDIGEMNMRLLFFVKGEIVNVYLTLEK